MAKDTFKYKQLIAGEVPYIVTVEVANNTYKAGDILELTASGESLGANFTKATDVTMPNIYVVCAEDKTTSGTGNDKFVTAYKEGYFNVEEVKVNDRKADATKIKKLFTKNIFLVPIKK